MPPNDHERLEQTWLGKLAKLNPAPGRGACRGVAPHKPLLVFALIDMAEAGLLPDRFFMRSPELVLRFRSYGSIVSERWPTRLDLRMPFYHLSTQHLWEAFTTDRRRATSPEDCAVGEIDPEFFGLLSEPEFCRKARLLLMTRYFEPAEHLAFCESLGFTPTEELQRQSRQLLGAALQSAKRKGRSARFAVQVVTQYRFTCALTGYRCITTEGGSIVDAAHIEAWAQTQNATLTNGLALSKTATRERGTEFRIHEEGNREEHRRSSPDLQAGKGSPRDQSKKGAPASRLGHPHSTRLFRSLALIR